MWGFCLLLNTSFPIMPSRRHQDGLRDPLDPLWDRPKLKHPWALDLHKPLLWLADQSDSFGLLELVSAQSPYLAVQGKGLIDPFSPVRSHSSKAAGPFARAGIKIKQYRFDSTLWSLLKGTHPLLYSRGSGSENWFKRVDWLRSPDSVFVIQVRLLLPWPRTVPLIQIK